MKVLKRNQIIISVLALMLITVGYMSFSNNMHNSVETGALMDAEKMAGIGDAKLVNSNTVNQNNNGNDDLEIELEDEQIKKTLTTIIQGQFKQQRAVLIIQMDLTIPLLAVHQQAVHQQKNQQRITIPNQLKQLQQQLIKLITL